MPEVIELLEEINSPVKMSAKVSSNAEGGTMSWLADWSQKSNSTGICKYCGHDQA